jgi:glycine/serine hydroxymethyltransferase
MTIGAAYDGNSSDPNVTITSIRPFSGALANLKVYSVAIPPGNLAMLMGTPIDMKQDVDNRINFKDLALFANNWMASNIDP